MCKKQNWTIRSPHSSPRLTTVSTPTELVVSSLSRSRCLCLCRVVAISVDDVVCSNCHWKARLMDIFQADMFDMSAENKWRLSEKRNVACKWLCFMIKPVSYVRPSVSPQKSFFDFNEIWRAGIGRWVMHEACSMTRSKVKVTSPSKLEILPFPKAISSCI